MKYLLTPLSFFYLAFSFSLLIFAGCGEAEDAETGADLLAESIELTYDTSKIDIAALRALKIPPNWEQTEDAELRARYYHTILLNKFGDIPAVHIVAEFRLNAAKGITPSVEEYITFLEAFYLLYPSESTRKHLIEMRNAERPSQPVDENKLRHEDPEAYYQLQRARFIKNYGNTPEVRAYMEYVRKIVFNLPMTLDDMIAGQEALVKFLPTEDALRRLKKLREAKAAGIPLHLIDWDDVNGE